MPDPHVFDTLPLVIRPNPARTLVRPFDPGDPEGVHKPCLRRRRIADRIAAIPEAEIAALLADMCDPLSQRMRDPGGRLHDRYAALAREEVLPAMDEARTIVAGAFFSQEYAYESAALFNPSIVPHPDQSGLVPGETRLLMALRGVGEGHISSVTFRVLRWTPGQVPVVEPSADRATTPRIEAEGEHGVLFTWPKGTDPSEVVLFPATPSQKQGIEDMRLVRFVEDDGRVRLFGTYTAFSGSAARSEMLEVIGTDRFSLRPLTGHCARDKGMALFPRRIRGRYVMLGRIDGENMFLMRSDDPYEWNEATLLLEPHAGWEAVQVGNCGSPVEIDEGWLVLTHGVGPLRSYSMGAVLLDRDDPTRILARTPRPLLRPRAEDRGGYVPNVIYSCGAFLSGRDLLVPHAVCDHYTAFATTTIDRLLAAMT